MTTSHADAEPLEDLVAEYMMHKTAAADHKQAADRLLAMIGASVEKGNTAVGNFTIVKSDPNRTFATEDFEKAFPLELNPTLSKTVVDTAALPPKIKAQFMVPGTGDPKVAVK